MKRNLGWRETSSCLLKTTLQVKSLLPAILADNEGEIVTFKSGF
ncbi:hypothetical protein [Yersinia canariae]|nr:hypothetical protein [Yersinia canariae]